MTTREDQMRFRMMERQTDALESIAENLATIALVLNDIARQGEREDR